MSLKVVLTVGPSNFLLCSTNQSLTGEFMSHINIQSNTNNLIVIIEY